MSTSLIGRLGSSAFRLFHDYGVDVARGFKPLVPADQTEFLQALVERLRDQPEVGDCVLFKAARELMPRWYYRKVKDAAAPAKVQVRDLADRLRYGLKLIEQ